MAFSVFISWTSEWIVMVASSALKAGCADACVFVYSHRRDEMYFTFSCVKGLSLRLFCIVCIVSWTESDVKNASCVVFKNCLPNSCKFIIHGSIVVTVW